MIEILPQTVNVTFHILQATFDIIEHLPTYQSTTKKGNG